MDTQLLSKTINILRFPLIVGVVFIHSYICRADIESLPISSTNATWAIFIFDFISNGIARISVPCFFFISGFLFFFQTKFTFDIYIQKLRRRFHTLLLPYILWNLIGFSLLLIQLHPRIIIYFPSLIGFHPTAVTFIESFYGLHLPKSDGALYPVDFPLWYIRDLILLILISPIIHWFIKHLQFFFILTLGCLWYMGTRVLGMDFQGIFFFPLGAWFSINNINFVKVFKNIGWLLLPLYIILVTTDTLTKNRDYNIYIHHAGVLIGLIIYFIIAAYFIEHTNKRISQFLTKSTFFIFALHGLFIGKYLKLLIAIINPASLCSILFIYFFVPITSIFSCSLLYYLFNRYLPFITQLLTGEHK